MLLAKELADNSDLELQQVMDILLDGSKKYKVYTIPKRTHGRRTIAHPAKPLKYLQRLFVDLYPLPFHSNSVAYRKSYSIKNNAEFHKANKYLLKMDLANYFNSLTTDVFWNEYNRNGINLSFEFNKSWIENLLFWQKSQNELVLSVGAPTSPMLSNFCMFRFDEILTAYCLKNGITYTRYADDLTFTTNKKNILFHLPDKIETFLKAIYGNALSVNHQKTVFSSKAHNRHVTGLTITNEDSISLGRNRKKYIKHLVHYFLLNKLDKEDVLHLRGLLSFAKHVEPKFCEALDLKYGANTVQKVLEVDNEF